MEDRFRVRAWDKESKSYFNPLDTSVNGLVLSVKGIKGNFDMYGQDLECDKFIMEQCTGLKDKNGKLIYEGDVLRLVSETVKVEYVVKWNKHNAQLFLDVLNDWGQTDFYTLDSDEYEIIGNIHEKSELLEEDNNAR